MEFAQLHTNVSESGPRSNNFLKKGVGNGGGKA